jgi:hypothetical protein
MGRLLVVVAAVTLSACGLFENDDGNLTVLAIGDGPVFAVVGPDFATDAAYVVPDGPAFAILDALFTRAADE